MLPDTETRPGRFGPVGGTGRSVLESAAPRPAPEPSKPGRSALSRPILRGLVDAGASALAAGAVASTGRGFGWPDWVAVAAFPPLVVTSIALRGEYRSRLKIDLVEELAGAAIAVSLSAIAMLSVMLVAGSQTRPGAVAVPITTLAFVVLMAERVAIATLRRRMRRRGADLEPLVIVGAGLVGSHIGRLLGEHSEYGVEPVGCVDDDPLCRIGEPAAHCRVLGGLDDLPRIIRERHVRHVVFGFSSAPDRSLLPSLRRCEALGVSVHVVPRMFDAYTNRIVLEHVGGLPITSVHHASPHGWEFALKHGLDRVLAVVFLVLTAPLLAAIALAVWVDDGGPVIYRQRRVGRDDCEFCMLKFRTMRDDHVADVDASAHAQLSLGLATGGISAGGVDWRTRTGRFLRRTSLDELPQLINVLRGDMSFVGPRPERPYVVDIVKEDIARYGERHRVKSGLTGWAQVNGLRGNTSLADRAEFDNYYIENWSLWLDLKIMLATVRAMLSGDDA
jgi:exopolysaccharide biosynthesis polyprenyl glycosylphosphotransferase